MCSHSRSSDPTRGSMLVTSSLRYCCTEATYPDPKFYPFNVETLSQDSREAHGNAKLSIVLITSIEANTS